MPSFGVGGEWGKLLEDASFLFNKGECIMELLFQMFVYVSHTVV